MIRRRAAIAGGAAIAAALAIAALVVFGLGLPWWSVVVTLAAVGVVLTFFS